MALVSVLGALGCVDGSATDAPVLEWRTVRIAVGVDPECVAVADLNRDGRPDLAVANGGSGTATILLGDGKGGFSEAKGSPFAAGHAPNDVVAADFDGSGTLDLAFANHDEKALTVLLGDGRGGFRPALGSPFVVDVKPHTHGIAAGDLDGDGRLDLLTDSWGTDQLCMLSGDGKGGFRSPGVRIAVGKHPYQRARVADLDGDGHADIIAPDLDGGDVTVLLAEGRGGFRKPEGAPFPAGDAPFGVAIGDVNADGKPDLAVVNSPSLTSDRTGRDSLAILLGDGTGRFSAVTGPPLATGAGPTQAAIGDLDGDGVGDVAVANQTAGTVTVFLMDRKGQVRSTTTIKTGREPDGIAIADLDGDGRGDLVVCDSGDGILRLLLSAGSGRTARTQRRHSEQGSGNVVDARRT